MEFHYRATDDFLLEVVHFDIHEMRERLLGLLRYYRAMHLPSTEEPTTDAAILENLATQAELAAHTFNTMFRSPDLSELLTGSEESSLATLLRWQEESAPARSSGGATYTDEEICSKALERLSSEQRPSNGNAEVPLSPWPYIKKIR